MALRIINIVPPELSSETNRDAGPSIAVNPADPRQIVIAALTPDPTGAPTNPYFYSVDAGRTFALNSALPFTAEFYGITHISVRFAGSSGILYVGRRGRTDVMEILRKRNFAVPDARADVLSLRAYSFQPWVEAATQADTDRVFVSFDSYVGSGPTRQAYVFRSLDAGASRGGFAPALMLESRTSALSHASNAYGTFARTAIHRAGVIYGASIAWRDAGPPISADVVVVRDDDWASSATPFHSLLDPIDGLQGLRVVAGISIAGSSARLGNQAIAPNLAIAVDPRNWRRVYLAWCDGHATAESPFTLHVRRSADGGASWSADLLTIADAINPGLAVNVQGTVALLYQEHLTVGLVNRWRTLLVRSIDRFDTVATNTLLADVLDRETLDGESLGHQTNLLAIGKDFYGVFAADNLPVLANFPEGVTYLRHHDFVTQRLLGADGTSVVAPSLDPFFFHYETLDPHRDFYVRDWTESESSGDDGSEPSVKQAFCVTPDLWNRRSTLPGSLTAAPENEDPGNGMDDVGDNWLFARIRRKEAAPAGSPDVTVSAHFLVSKFGIGSNYVDATEMDSDVVIDVADPTATFVADEVGPKLTPPLHWHLNPISSAHLCVAVEISTPDDPYLGQSLRGRAPGWPSQDLEIIDDNNKAQRNMAVAMTPARGSKSMMAAFGIVHNAATTRRDIQVRYRVDPDLLKRASKIQIDAPGDGRIDVRSAGTIVLKQLEPGENRWLGVRFILPAASEGELLSVYFDELVGSTAINGFALGVRASPTLEFIRYALVRHLSVCIRLAAGFQIRAAKKQAKRTEATLDAIGRQGLAPVRPWLEELIGGAFFREVRTLLGEKDDFGILEESKRVRKLFRRERTIDGFVGLVAYLECLDSQLTQFELQTGDRADILQNVSWQRDILSRIDPSSNSSSRAIEKHCAEFIESWFTHQVGPHDYPKLIRGLLGPLTDLSKAVDDRRLRKRLRALSAVGETLEALQCSHRALLLRLEALSRQSITRKKPSVK